MIEPERIARCPTSALALAMLSFACQPGANPSEEPSPSASATSEPDEPPPNPFPDCIHPEVVEDCTDGWCRIPAGCFVMGSPEDEWGRGMNTEEQMAVTLTRPFAILQHEVTQGEWMAAGLPLPPTIAVSDTDCLEPDCPVRHITWFEAIAYANLLSARHDPPLAPCYELVNCYHELGEEMGCETARSTAPTVYECEGYRLPTEAEWEYAARAGTRMAFYSGGITPQADTGTCYLEPNLEDIAWYCNNYGGTTHPVGQKRPNAWGIHDILGNVPEWTNDYSEAAHPPGPLADPGGRVEQIVGRVTKGGSAVSWSPLLRCASRGEASWDFPRFTGLRLVRTLPPRDAP